MMKHAIFSKINPQDYAQVSVLARLAGETMISRLELTTLKPKVIVDVGCGIGIDAGFLKQRYQEAEIFAVDSSQTMLDYISNPDIKLIHANTLSLPFKDYSVDLIFANLLLPWCEDWEKVFKEWRRILKPEGLLMFTSYGLDTLRELTNIKILPRLVDMHELGDVLTQARFSDPVMDVEYLTLNYKNSETLFDELKNSGMIETKQPGCDVLSLTYELIYGHAFGPPQSTEHSADEDGIVKIPLSHLRR